MINLSRCGFGAALAALPLATVLPHKALALSNGPLPRLPVTARYQIGRFEVTVISDGYIDFPFELFTGATPDQARATAAAVYAAGNNGVTRARFFSEAAEQKALIAATHMPFPGVGRIVGDAGALRWLPADWSYT